MRSIVFIGADYCAACNTLRRTVAEPLKELYPDNVSIHHAFDAKVAEVDARKTIDHIPLVVIEKDGAEEFRCSGGLSINALEDIILCDRDTLTAEEVLR